MIGPLMELYNDVRACFPNSTSLEKQFWSFCCWDLLGWDGWPDLDMSLSGRVSTFQTDHNLCLHLMCASDCDHHRDFVHRWAIFLHDYAEPLSIFPFPEPLDHPRAGLRDDVSCSWAGGQRVLLHSWYGTRTRNSTFYPPFNLTFLDSSHGGRHWLP